MARRFSIEPTLQPVSLVTPRIYSSDVSNGFERPSNTSSYSELADAFQQINPSLAKIVDIKTQNDKEKDFFEAQKEVASNTLEQNKKTLSELSKKGAISEGKNPWTNIYRSELLAHNIVTQQVANDANSGLASVSQSSSSPDDAKKFLVDLHNKYMKDFENNPYAQKSFESSFSSLSNEFLQQSEAIRHKNIMIDAKAGFQDNLSNVLNYYSEANINDPEVIQTISDNIKQSLDDARLHGITDANGLFLEQFNSTISGIAQTDPSKAKNMLAILDSIKPNGIDSISNTAAGRESISSLNYHILRCQRQIVSDQTKAIKQRNTQINIAMQDSATMWREKNPNATSDEFKKYMTDTFGRSDPTVIRMADKLISNDRTKSLNEAKQKNEESMNTLTEALASGNYTLAQNLIEQGSFTGKDFLKAKKLYSDNVNVQKKLSQNALIINAFGIYSNNIREDQQRAINGLNKMIINEAINTNSSIQDIINDPNRLRPLVETQGKLYQSHQKLEADIARETSDKYENKGVWSYIGQIASGSAAIPVQVGANLASTANWLTESAIGRKSEGLTRIEWNANNLVDRLTDEMPVAKDVSEMGSSLYLLGITGINGSASQIIGKNFIAGLTDKVEEDNNNSETVQRIEHATMSSAGMIAMGIVSKYGSMAKSMFDKSPIIQKSIANIRDLIGLGKSPMQAAAETARKLELPEVAQGIEIADEMNKIQVKEQLAKTIKQLPNNTLNELAYAVDKQNNGSKINSLLKPYSSALRSKNTQLSEALRPNAEQLIKELNQVNPDELSISKKEMSVIGNLKNIYYKQMMSSKQATNAAEATALEKLMNDFDSINTLYKRAGTSSGITLESRKIKPKTVSKPTKTVKNN